MNEELKEKLKQFKEWMYEREYDWAGCPEELSAHRLVIAKFEELGLDEIGLNSK